MPSAPHAPSSRRTIRRVATLGLCAGAICLLAGAAVYWGSASGVTLAIRQRSLLPAATTDLTLVLAAVAVLGTVLVSVGVVFALFQRTNVLAAVAVPHYDLAAPEPRHGDAALTRNNPPRVGATASDHGARLSGKGNAEPSAFPSGGTARHVCLESRTDRVSRPDAPGAPPNGSGEPLKAREAEPGAGVLVGAGPKVRSPETEAGEARRTKAPQPGDLIAAWEDYRRNGDGRFSRLGLQGLLDQRALEANVRHGDRIDAGDAVLIVETPSNASRFYVLPNFNKSPRAVAEWFDDSSGGALTGRTQRVARVAQGRWVEAGTGKCFEVIEKGEVA